MSFNNLKTNWDYSMEEDVLFVPTTKYVYFDDFGEIISVANSNKVKGNFIEVEQGAVVDIINGIEQPSSYCVIYDGIEKKYILKNKNLEEIYSITVRDNIHEICEFNLIDADIFIKQNTIDKKWTIELNQQVINNVISTNKSFFNTNLHFAITRRNDPHELYRNFSISFEQLIDSSVDIPFASQEECSVDKVSVYTIKKFKKYSREAVNEKV